MGFDKVFYKEFYKEFYKGKKVLVTGHTGFKGSWMCTVLEQLGAEVTGYSLEAPTEPSLFEKCGIEKRIHSVIGDIRDQEHLGKVFQEVQPEIVIHMAAQPIVRESYRNPVYTYDVNVMGTVNLLECIRLTPSVRSVVNVTTDKVYRNPETSQAMKEEDFLDGYDPYSNSKSCSELVTASYVRSFLTERGVSVSTVRAGNVIGGGDYAKDRIIPDCFRAAAAGKEVVLRNPDAVRPFQHVLEPVYVYLMIAARQYQDPTLAGCYNVGPDACDFYTVGRLVELFCDCWNRLQDKRKEAGYGKEIPAACWRVQPDGGPHEAKLLMLDCARLKAAFDWTPVWTMVTTMEKTVEWYAADAAGTDLREVMIRQIAEFEDAR